MSIPEDALQFDAKIVGMGEIDMSGMNPGWRCNNNKNNNKIQKKKPWKNLKILILKNKKEDFLNQLIQGASKKGHYMFHMVDEELNRYKS